MRVSVRRVMWMWWILACVLAQFPALAQEQQKPTPPPTNVPVEISRPESDLDSGSSEGLNISLPDRINAVIYPYQSATIGTEVRGILDRVNFKEGDSVSKDSVVAEISKARYSSMVGEFRGNYDAVVRTLDRAREELTIQEELYDKRATTYDDVLKAQAQVQVLEARKEEAIHKLKQAELNLQACVLKAPFSGIIAVLYHEPFEAVDNLEKVFGLIDTVKVYARANWPESRLSELALNKKAVFLYGDKTYEGVIEKISSLIDPASKSKRVHILIDNPQAKLEVGMSGSVNLIESKKLSMSGAGLPPLRELMRTERPE